MIRTFQYGEVPNEELFIRSQLIVDVAPVVTEILDDVRKNGDEALFRLTEKFDHAKLTSLEVSQEEIDEAYNSVGEDYIAVLRQAAENIEAYHKNQVRPGFIMTKENGVILGQKVTPIAAVGLYVPNGTAAYPSSLLMNCVPAKIAGCPLLVTVTPPFWLRQKLPAWIKFTKSAVPKPWLHWLTARKPFPRWIRLSAPAMRMWPRRKSRCSARLPLTPLPGPAKC